MENLSKIFQWLSKLPLWLRAIALLLIAGLVLLSTLTGCSSPRSVAKVYNRAESTSTSVQMTTGDGGTVTVTATPSFQNTSKPSN